MGIPTFAIDEFLNEPRDSHDWMKDLHEGELRDAIRALEPRPWLPEAFDKHQMVGFLLGVAYPQFCYWYDMGTGKTLLTLTLLRYHFDRGRVNKALITVLNDPAIDGWMQQIDEWRVDLPGIPLFKGTSESKWNAVLEQNRGLVLVGYPGLRAMVSTKKAREKKTGGTAVELKKVPEKITKLLKGIRASVWDESTELGNPGSLNFAVARTICRETHYRYALAGQPFGRDPMMMWAQMFLIDGGASLGPTQGLFKEALYSKKKRPFGGAHSFDWTFKSSMQGELNRMCKHRSIAYDESECGDLPEMVQQTVRVHFPDSAQTYYKTQLRRLQAARGDYKEMQNAFTRLRQISSGFLGVKDDESGDRVELEFETNPKLSKLLDLTLQVPAKRKFLVFYEFTHSGRRIMHALESAGFRPAWLWSGTKDPQREIAAIKADSMDVDCAVVNWKVGAFSLNFQRANYEFVYESPVGVIPRRQMEKRIQRKGQEWTCFLYDLVTEGTVDERILDFHRQGLDFFEAVLRDPSVGS